MKQLNLPIYTFNTKTIGGRPSIFDRVRKRFVALTPEEWVRQNFINYLIEEKNYPESLLASEMEIKLYGLSRRCDSVVYSNTGTPLMILEFKAPDIAITQKTFDQIASYNLTLKVQYLIVSNGLKHYCLRYDSTTKSFNLCTEIPVYSSL